MLSEASESVDNTFRYTSNAEPCSEGCSDGQGKGSRVLGGRTGRRTQDDVPYVDLRTCKKIHKVNRWILAKP